jgi:hypothetical protein
MENSTPPSEEYDPPVFSIEGLLIHMGIIEVENEECPGTI